VRKAVRKGGTTNISHEYRQAIKCDGAGIRYCSLGGVRFECRTVCTHIPHSVESGQVACVFAESDLSRRNRLRTDSHLPKMCLPEAAIAEPPIGSKTGNSVHRSDSEVSSRTGLRRYSQRGTWPVADCRERLLTVREPDARASLGPQGIHARATTRSRAWGPALVIVRL